MDSVPACELEVHWFNPQSGHVPGIRPGLQLGARERRLAIVSLPHWCFSPSLLLSLNINFKNLKKQRTKLEHTREVTEPKFLQKPSKIDKPLVRLIRERWGEIK